MNEEILRAMRAPIEASIRPDDSLVERVFLKIAEENKAGAEVPEISDEQGLGGEKIERSEKASVKRRTGFIISIAAVFAVIVGFVVVLNLMKNKPAKGGVDSSSGNKETMVMSADEPYYADLAALSDAADMIFEGSVIGKHIRYIDDTTGKIVSESDDAYLYTVYDVKISVTYKGDISVDTVKVKVPGDNESVFAEHFVDLETEKKYLFFADSYESVYDPMPLVSSVQGVYYINEDREYVPVVESNLETIPIREEDLWDDSLYLLLPKEGTEEYEKAKQVCAETIEYLNEIKDDYYITDIEDKGVWLSVTVDPEKYLKMYINFVDDKANNGKAYYWLAHVHPPLKEVVAEASETTVTDTEEIEKLAKKYKYELGILNIGLSVRNSGVGIETINETFVEPLKEYLEACNVDMSLVTITPQFLRYNT